MSILSNMSLRTKLVGGFVIVAALTGLIGVVSYWGIHGVSQNLLTVGNNCMPSIRSLMEVRLGGEKTKVVGRTLLNLDCEADVHKKQYEDLATAREWYGQSWKMYESLKHTPEEQQLWSEFSSAWDAFRNANNEFMRMSHEMDNMQIGNPTELSERVASARVDYNRICRKTLEMLISKKYAEASGNATAAMDDLNKWATSAAAQNADLRLAMQEITATQRKFLDAYAKINDLARKGQFDTATNVYLEEMRPAINTVVGQFDKLIVIAKRGQDLFEKMNYQQIKVCRDAQNKSTEILDKLIASINKAATETVENAEKNANSAIATVSTATVVCFVGALLLGIIIAVSITRPILKGVTFAKIMATGDLTHTLDIDRNDEIGVLAHSLNEMGANLRRMFGAITQNTNVLANSSTNLSSAASELASGAEEATNQSTTVAAAAEELTNSITSMASSTHEMSSNVKTVASAVEEMTASITEVARSAQEAASVAQNAAQLAHASDTKIEQLGSAANDIGKVIDEIQDIAEQTNLLALNATIEAARAGDAGKGFAVVATEVKELAKQTAAATEDIRKRIIGIQGSTAEAVHSIHEISTVIANVDNVSRTIASAVEEQSITTKEIARNIAQTSTAAETVAKGVAESATVTKEIAKNIAEVNIAAKQTAQGASVAQDASAQLQQVAAQLSSMVGQFQTAG